MTTLPDLLIPCADCEGVGIVANPDFEAFWERHGKDCTLRECGSCAGNPEESACPECEGAKVRTTEAGKQILELLFRLHPQWFSA